MRHPTELLALRRRSCCSSKLVRVLDECNKCVEEAASLDEIAVFFKGIGVADIKQNGLSTELSKLGVTSPKDLLLLDQVIA